MLQWWCAAQGVPWTWSWQAYPGVWAFCGLLIGAWARMRGRWPARDDTSRRTAIFLTGVATLWIALDWPVGALGAGYLASVHMVQYILIALVAPPLLLAGVPRGAYAALASGALGGPLRVITHPLVAMTTFVAIQAITHWPPLVDTWMATQLGSFGLDLLWLSSGLLFWWPVVAPKPERGWLTDGTRIGYLIVATLVNTGVFAYLAFTELPLYATYELAPPVAAISSRDDQLVAGLLMKFGGAVVMWVSIGILFFRAYTTSDSLGKGEPLSIPTGRIGLIVLLALVPLAGACGFHEPEAQSQASGDATGEATSRTTDDAREDEVPDPWLEAGPLQVRSARIGNPPLPDRAGGYLTLRNPGVEPVRIVGARMPGVEAVSFHTSEMTGGMMRMAPSGPIELAPGETVELAPGGRHLMLENLEAALVEGGAAPITFELEDGTTFIVEMRVVALSDLEGA